MKRASVLFLLVLAASADARRVIHMPTLGELCPGNDSWDSIAQCIRRQAPFTLVHDGAGAKIVSISEMGRFSGVYVYTHAKKWALRGELRLYHERDVLGFTRVELGQHTGYRVDIGVATAMPMSFDGEMSVPTVLRQQHTLLCLDDRADCLQIVTACDLLVHGKAYSSFRGSLQYTDRQLKVVGDRRNAGMMCVQSEVVLND